VFLKKLIWSLNVFKLIFLVNVKNVVYIGAPFPRPLPPPPPPSFSIYPDPHHYQRTRRRAFQGRRDPLSLQHGSKIFVLVKYPAATHAHAAVLAEPRHSFHVLRHRLRHDVYLLGTNIHRSLHGRRRFRQLRRQGAPSRRARDRPGPNLGQKICSRHQSVRFILFKAFKPDLSLSKTESFHQRFSHLHL